MLSASRPHPEAPSGQRSSSQHQNCFYFTTYFIRPLARSLMTDWRKTIVVRFVVSRLFRGVSDSERCCNFHTAESPADHQNSTRSCYSTIYDASAGLQSKVSSFYWTIPVLISHSPIKQSDRGTIRVPPITPPANKNYIVLLVKSKSAPFTDRRVLSVPCPC